GAAFSFSGTDPRSGKRFVAMSIESGGWGGRSGFDGQDVSMSVCQGDVRNSPIETLELKTPVLVLERSVRQDSGGAGKFRGGMGIQTRARSLTRGSWNASSPSGGRITCPPWGLRGGKPGKTAATWVRAPGESEFHAPPSPRFAAEPGAEILYQTAGGGGWGDPLERDVERVLQDALAGFISQEAAHDEYGVVLRDGGIDLAATQALRARLKSKRHA